MSTNLVSEYHSSPQLQFRIARRLEPRNSMGRRLRKRYRLVRLRFWPR